MRVWKNHIQTFLKVSDVRERARWSRHKQAPTFFHTLAVWARPKIRGMVGGGVEHGTPVCIVRLPPS
jgi:hypothetical protein